MATKNPAPAPASHFMRYQAILGIPDAGNLEDELATFHDCLALGGCGGAAPLARKREWIGFASAGEVSADTQKLMELANRAGPETLEALAALVRRAHLCQGRKVRRSAEEAADIARRLTGTFEAEIFDAMRRPESDLGDEDSMRAALEVIAGCAGDGEAASLLCNVVTAYFGGDLSTAERCKVADELSEAVRKLGTAATSETRFDVQEACLGELRAMCRALVFAPVLDEPSPSKPVGRVDELDRQDQLVACARQAGWFVASSARGTDAAALRQICEGGADLKPSESSDPVKLLLSLVTRSRGAAGKEERTKNTAARRRHG